MMEVNEKMAVFSPRCSYIRPHPVRPVHGVGNRFTVLLRDALQGLSHAHDDLSVTMTAHRVYCEIFAHLSNSLPFVFALGCAILHFHFFLLLIYMKKISMIALAGSALLLAACTGSVSTDTGTESSSSAAMEATSSDAAMMEATSSDAMMDSSSSSSVAAMIDAGVEAGAAMEAATSSAL